MGPMLRMMPPKRYFWIKVTKEIILAQKKEKLGHLEMYTGVFRPKKII